MADMYEELSDRLRQECGKGDIRIIMEAAEAIDDLRYQVAAYRNKKPKTGKWVLDYDEDEEGLKYWHYFCSSCGEEYNYFPSYIEANSEADLYHWLHDELKYCPNCGAKM